MATPTAPVPESEAALDAAADARLAALTQGQPASVAPAGPVTEPVAAPPFFQPTPASEPAVPPQPPTEPGAQPPTEPAAAPVSPTAAPEVISIDLSKLPPEDQSAWRNALAKTNGDPAKIASLMWEYNNRLAQLAAPAATPAQPAQPAEPEIDYDTLVARETQEALSADVESQGWFDQHARNLEAIEEIQRELDVPAEARAEDRGRAQLSIRRTLEKLDDDIHFNERRSKEPDVAEDPERKAEYRNTLLTLRDAKQRLQTLVDANRSLNQNYIQKRDRIREEIAGRYESERAAQRTQRQIEADVAAYANEFSQAWPGYVSAAVAAERIPAELQPSFNEFAKTHAIIAQDRGLLDMSRETAPVQLPQFLAAAGKAFMEQVRLHHRVLLAAGSAPSTQPVVIPAGSVVPAASPAQTPTSPQRPQSASEIDAAADARRVAILRGLVGG